MTTTPTQPMQDVPSTVQRMPVVAEALVLTRAPRAPHALHAPVRQTAVVQVLDFYPAAEVIRRTAKQWEVTC